jgi:Tat protein translocase TatB subunit
MLALPRRLASVFNLTGSEIAFLVLIGLIVLGPEKLPDAVRKFTKAYNEFKKMATGFQGEVKQAFEEPMRELRGTAEAMKNAADFGDLGLDLGIDAKKQAKREARSADQVQHGGGLNFGNTNAQRQERAARDTSPETANPEAVEPETASE